MESNRNLISTEFAGTVSGTEFDDRSIVPDIGTAVISKIVFAHAEYVQSLTVHYGTHVATTRGQATGRTTSEVVLAPDEYITSLQGNYAGGPISDLRLETSKGRKWGPYGTYSANSTTSAFNRRTPSSDMGLLYFSGRADTSYIWQLKATWAKYQYQDKLTSCINYEEHACDELSTQPQFILSKFARNLMSPSVTLFVGRESVEFRASESILCSLPFFRAAFLGGFKEATEKKIEMPEDEPETVSALIEFLYNGNYTYVYDPWTTERPDKNVPPVGDLREGAFHVRVYATASKYDCQPLAKAAVKSFIYILLQLKGIDVVRHWKTAYENGLSLSDLEDDQSLARFKTGLGKLLKRLYAAYREEMDKTFVECPALGTDFLRVAVCSGMDA